MRSILKYTGISLFVISLFSACEKEYESIEQVDERKIQAYIDAQNLNLIKDSSGIYYQIINPGAGLAPKNSEIVYYLFTAKSIDGKEYFTAKSYATSATFLGYVRPDGWKFALSKINKGGKIRVVIPSSLGFGRNGEGVFEGNEVLDSELELLNVNTRAEMEDVLINRFLTANSLTGFSKLPSGVYYKIIAPGAGTEEVRLSSTITAGYTGRLLNGTVFDSATPAKPLTSKLEGLIPAWEEALPLIKKGGKIRLLLPSSAGYASENIGSIPPNSVLDFDIELIDVKNE